MAIQMHRLRSPLRLRFIHGKAAGTQRLEQGAIADQRFQLRVGAHTNAQRLDAARGFDRIGLPQRVRLVERFQHLRRNVAADDGEAGTRQTTRDRRPHAAKPDEAYFHLLHPHPL
nr:hypothetical protein [Solimonas soli]